MVNKQVIGKGRVGGAWGGEETPFLVARGLRGLCTGERINQWGGGGALSQGALWSHTVYEKYLHAFTTLGPGTPKRPVGTWGGAARPSAPQMVTPGPSLGLSVNLYSVGFYLQSPRLGRHILGESQDSLGSHPAPKSYVGSALCGSPGLEAWWTAKPNPGGLAPAS